MTTYRELLAQVKEEISEIDARQLADELATAQPPLLIDVREPDEYEQGAILEAVHIPRGFLESRGPSRRCSTRNVAAATAATS